MREALEQIERLGLGGPVQVHVAPVVLVVDRRAHQVLLGFDSGAKLAARLGTERPCWRRERGAWRQCRLGEDGWAESVVVPAEPGVGPGGFAGLVEVVDRLLGPGGCPWDQAQTHESLKRYLLEEAYELFDAIDAQDEGRMIEELGDVLLQPVMHAQMRKRDGGWDIEHVADRIAEKLVRRHPHVFGDTEAFDAEQVLRNWDAIKKAEKGEGGGVLDGVPRAMPALARALEVSKRAARSGFEWPDIEGVWDKLDEEEAELRAAVDEGKGIDDELGDVLFTVVNLARWLKVDPEDALRRMIDRFTARYRAMERSASRPLGELSGDEREALWQSAKSSSGPA